MTDYLKEDRKKVLQRAKELKESAFSREFAQQMRQKGEGGMYRSKVTGQNIRLAYASKPAAKPSAPAPAPVAAPVAAKPSVRPAKPSAPPAPATAPTPASATATPRPGLSTGKLTLPSVNVGKPKAEPEMKGRMISPSDSGISNKPASAPDYSFVGSKKEMRQGAPMAPPGSPPNAPAVSGVRDFGANPPSSLAQTAKAPETPKSDNKPEVSSALQGRISPENLGSNPANLVNKDVTKGRETNKPINESVVNVGGNRYRIV